METPIAYCGKGVEIFANTVASGGRDDEAGGQML
jgi:hypothetical protein